MCTEHRLSHSRSLSISSNHNAFSESLFHFVLRLEITVDLVDYEVLKVFKVLFQCQITKVLLKSVTIAMTKLQPDQDRLSH